MRGEQGPPCPKCQSDLTERYSDGVECRDCGHLWSPDESERAVRAVDGGVSGTRRDSRESDLQRMVKDFWSDGIGTGIGTAVASVAFGYGLGLAATVEQTDLTWTAIAGNPEFSVLTAMTAGALGLLMVGFGMGYHHRMGEEEVEAA